MHISITQQVRPSKDVEFWSSKSRLEQKHALYMKKNYLDTKKIVSMNASESEDGLTLTTEVTWDNEKSLLDFQSDSIIVENILDAMNQYAEKNGIIIKVIDTVSNMVNIQGPMPYPNLQIPDSWDNVEAFGNWWIRSGMPIVFPDNAEVFLSDDATAICLFRKGRFQVELYLIHPNPLVPVHEHPGVDVIKVRLNGRKYPFLSTTLHDGESHGAGIRFESEDRGYPLLAIQHWHTREPSTVASMWKGDTVGPKQEALIKRFNPAAHVIEGWADITKSV